MTAGFAAAQQMGGPGMEPMMMQHQPPMEHAFANHGMDGQWWNQPRMAETLKLTDAQRKAMDKILFDHREKLIDLQASLEKAELAMQPLMSADQPNREAMEAQIDKVVQARADLEKANALFLLDIRMQLTPEQWKQLRTMHEMHDMRGHEHGWRHGGDRRQMMPPPPPDGQQPPQAPSGTAPSPAPGAGDQQ